MSNRKVSTDALETLGTLIDETQKRDAIHLAVDPVIAGQTLAPGEHIRVENGVAYAAPEGKGHGIVDPFLSGCVRHGQRFWFVMYPRQVHSLRHVWTHPDFPSTEVEGKSGSSSGLSDIDASKLWMLNFAADNHISYSELLQSAGSNDDSEYCIIYGSDASGGIPSEFWHHAEIILGKKLTHAKYFSCSC